MINSDVEVREKVRSVFVMSLRLSDHQGPVARSLISANRWLRDIKTYRFPWHLSLVSANHAWSNRGQVLHNTASSSSFFPISLGFSRFLRSYFVLLNFWSLRNLIKQLFHLRLLDMRLVIANSRSWNNCYLFTSDQTEKYKTAPRFTSVTEEQILSLKEARLIIQLVWYILKQLFTSTSVKLVNIYQCLLPLRRKIVNY